MKKQDFDGLLLSLNQSLAIAKDDILPTKITTFDKTQNKHIYQQTLLNSFSKNCKNKKAKT